MNTYTENVAAAIKALETANIEQLFADKIKDPSELEDHEGTDNYALMFNCETGELFFLPYAINNNGWNKTAEQQHPWITAGWVCARDIIMGNPNAELIQTLQYELDTIEAMDNGK